MSRDKSRDRSGSSSIRPLLAKLRRAFFAPGEELSQRVVHGGLWQLSERIASRAVNFVQLVVLARLLDPEDFGLFGIALLTQQTLDVLLQFGIDSALIQREERTEEYLDTAWTLKVLKATIAAICLVLVGPWVATFFEASGSAPVIRALAAIVLLQGLQNIGVIYFQKELQFRKQFALRFGGALANAVVAIVLAWIIGSVWAFVAGMAAASTVRLGISYILHPHRPKLQLEMDKARDLWQYGKWLFGSSTLVYASTQGDDILLGRWLGATALGVYQVGYRISNVVATEITKVISKVTFPAYARLQTAAGKLRRGFLSTFSLTSLIVVPLSSAIALFIPDFVQHVIGEQWEAAIGPVRILAIAGLLRALSACWGPLYRAEARTEKPFWKNAIRMVLTLGPAYPLTIWYGIEGMSVCVVFGIAGALGYDLLWTGARDGVVIEVSALLRELSGPAVVTLATVVSVIGLRAVSEPGLVSFLILALSYIVIYLLLLVLLEKTGWQTGGSRLLALLNRMD